MKKSDKTKCWGRCGKSTSVSWQAAASTEVGLPGTGAPDTSASQECSWRSQPKLTNIQELQTGGTENEAPERGGRLIPPEGLGYLVTPPQPRRGREDIPEGRLRRMSKGRQRQEGVDRGTDLHYVATWATIRSLAQAPEWGDSQKNEDRGGQVDAIAGSGRDWEGVQCGQRAGAGWKDSSDTLPTRCGIWGWEEDREVTSWCPAWEQGMGTLKPNVSAQSGGYS